MNTNDKTLTPEQQYIRTQEMFNEYEFLSGAYNELIQAHQGALMRLKKEPFQPMALQQRDDTKHDIDVLTPIVQELGYNLMDMIQGKYDIELKFLKRPSNATNKVRILKT